MLAASGTRLIYCAVEGHPNPAAQGAHPALTFRLETLGTLLTTLTAQGATQVCLAGRIDRPVIDPARIDAATAPLVPRFQQALAGGDDGALRILMDIIEDHGLSIVGAGTLLPDSLPPPGVLTQTQPPPGADGNIDRGRAVLAALGPLDVGQACIVAGGQVLAIEALPGTDFMLQGLSAPQTGTPPYARTRIDRALAGPPGGVLVKTAKPGQDLRADMPAIGPDTVAHAARAGLAGIAVGAGRVLILDRADTIQAADAAGLYIQVVS